MSLSPFLQRRLRALSAVASGEPLRALKVAGQIRRVVNVGEGASFRSRAGRREQQRAYRARGRAIAQRLDLQRLYIEHGPLVVRLVRVAPRSMDGDNLESALKRVRDGIAAAIGIDDRESSVEYVADQQRGEVGEKALLVEVFRQLERGNDPPKRLRARVPVRSSAVTIGGRLVQVTPNVTRPR